MYRTTARKHRNNDYDINEDLARIKDALADAAYDVRGKAGEMLKDKSNDFQESVTNYASEKPFKTIGIALLAGVVLGFLLKK